MEDAGGRGGGGGGGGDRLRTWGGEGGGQSKALPPPHPLPAPPALGSPRNPGAVLLILPTFVMCSRGHPPKRQGSWGVRQGEGCLRECPPGGGQGGVAMKAE